MYWLWLLNNHLAKGRAAAHPEHHCPVDAGEFLQQFGIGVFMVVGIYVAQLHLVVALLGYAVLYGHHCIHLLGCFLLGIADEGEELLAVGLVCFAHRLCLIVVVEIVVGDTKSKSSLGDAHHVLSGVAEIGSHTPREHHCVFSAAVELSRQTEILRTVLHVAQTLQGRFQWFVTLAVEPHAVHHEVVESAYLVTQCAGFLWFVGKLQYQLVNLKLVLVVEVHKRSVCHMFRVERMVLQPCSCGILYEIRSWFHSQVHVFLVVAFQVWLRAGCCRSGNKSQHNHLQCFHLLF